MIDFREIRAWVPAQDAVRFYGAKFDHRGWAICPFHGDTHPSISFKNGRFRCWSCGASGDALDYVSRLFDLDSVQAGQKLDADFHLGLSREHAQSLVDRLLTDDVWDSLNASEQNRIQKLLRNYGSVE